MVLHRWSDGINSSKSSNNTDSDTPGSLTAAVVYMAEGSLIFSFNFTTILVFAVNAHLRRRSVYFVLSLAFSDMMSGAVVAIHGLTLTKFKFNHNKELLVNCTNTTDVLFFAGSLLGLQLIALERMCAIVYPIRHRNLTNRAYSLAIAIQWGAAIVLTGIYVIRSPKLYFIVASIVLVVGLVTVATCYSIILITFKQQNRAHRQVTDTAQLKSQRRKRRLALTLFIVTALSLLTLTPTSVLLALYSVNEVTPLSTWIATGMRFLNSIGNPLVYVLRLNEFRHALFMLLFKCARDRPIGVIRQ
ncbi:predicted protein [Nematostella vectensis]|uniref:G-protein coupled receptors family 1 profile domain-containing protein n=1 Tax=Nematostella vectensis TaxID=45351 RepID=A7RP65_NEMVE|nr:predicted protein [Nematostella vectensis]|eukprot:XP_001638918.1 predicted protein [Nematostella vectensis]